MDTAQLMFQDLFEVLELKAGYTVLKFPSEFTVKCAKLGPYVFDELLKRPELTDPGPFMITIKLLENLQPPGIEQTIVYEPPRDDDGLVYEPDKERFPKEWAYFQQYRAHNKHRADVLTRREQARIDFALVNGIDVLDGPYTFEELDKWFTRIEHLYPDYKSYYLRYLLFLKTKVITPMSAGDIVRTMLMVEEVTVDGLCKAFDSFRRNLE